MNQNLKFLNYKKTHYSFINKKFKKKFKNKNLLGKLIIPNVKNYEEIKSKINNNYIKSNINDENMRNVFALSKILGIKEKNLIKSLKTFKSLPHRYEIFLKRKNSVFINDSKATSFQSTKFALQNTKNIFWIVGGLPKKNDKIILKNLKKNITRSYIIGKNINFFKKQIKNKVNFFIARNLKNAIKEAIKDLKFYQQKNNTILLSPSAASFDQFSNFEERGEKFKKLTKFYVRKYY